MDELDISLYKRYPKKVENEMLVAESERLRLPVNMGLPTRATINSTTDCNLRCDMCRYHGQVRLQHETLPFEVFESVAAQIFPTLKELHATVKGEPLLTPYWNSMLSLMAEYGVRLNLTTNGMLLTSEVSESIIPILRDVKVSFDGATKGTFERIRRGASFETVLENIKNFVRLRTVYLERNPGNYSPTLTMQAVLMRDTIEELPDIARLASEIGADRVKGFNLIVYDPAFLGQSLLYDQERSNRYLLEAKRVAKELGLETKYQEPFDGKSNIFDYEEVGERKRDCAFLWRQFNIDPDGNVRPCCHDKSPVMGSVYENSVKEVWNGEAYRNMRSRLDSEDLYQCCKRCAMISKKVMDARAFIFTDGGLDGQV